MQHSHACTGRWCLLVPWVAFAAQCEANRLLVRASYSARDEQLQSLTTAWSLLECRRLAPTPYYFAPTTCFHTYTVSAKRPVVAAASKSLVIEAKQNSKRRQRTAEKARLRNKSRKSAISTRMKKVHEFGWGCVGGGVGVGQPVFVIKKHISVVSTAATSIPLLTPPPQPPKTTGVCGNCRFQGQQHAQERG